MALLCEDRWVYGGSLPLIASPPPPSSIPLNLRLDSSLP